jgi:probable HAF family extracellular repeat protein
LLAGCGGGSGTTSDGGSNGPGNNPDPAVGFSLQQVQSGSVSVTLPTGINVDGDATGGAGAGVASLEAFSTAGSFQLLGKLGGTFSSGEAINDGDLVVGYYTTAGNLDRAFRHNGTMSDLGGFANNLESRALDVNNGGTAVGWAANNTARVAVQFDGSGGVVQLGDFGRGGAALVINTGGFIVGRSQNNAGLDQAFLYNPNDQSFSNIGNLGGTLGGTEARDISDNNVVVGSSVNANSFTRAFRYIGTSGMTELPLPSDAPVSADSEASAINGDGLIVGFVTYGPGDNRAVIWDSDGATDLNTFVENDLPAGVTLVDAVDINDSGQILAIGQSGSDRFAFILTPNS